MPTYETTNKLNYYQMKADIASKQDRLAKAQINRKTNFVAPDGFEAPSRPTNFGAVSNKEQDNTIAIKNMISTLKQANISLGGQTVSHSPASRMIGLAAHANTQTSTKKGIWASPNSNVNLGTDNGLNLTDYK